MKKLLIYFSIILTSMIHASAVDINLLKQSCENNDTESCLVLAMFYDTGENIDKNSSQSIAYTRKACDKGSAYGCKLLGYQYSLGKNIEKDYAKAKELFTKACDANASECAALGKLYDYGKGVNKDKQKAMEYYNKACDACDEDTCFDLGNMYANAKDSLTQDYSKAMDYYMKSCRAGKAVSCSNVGALYESGRGAKKNFLQAKLYYSMACLDGSADACSNLGILYENGKGVEKNFSQAKMYYTKACDKGDRDGCYNLALMYHTGEKIPQNYEKAINAYDKSCKLDYVKACSNLGVMYATGQGVEQYYSMAKKLWKKACDSGNQQACKNYKKIIKILRPVSIDTNRTAYVQNIATMIDNNLSIYDVASEIYDGYITLNTNRAKFSNYNDEILNIFPKDKWKIKSIMTSIKMLSKSMTLESIDMVLENMGKISTIKETKDKHYTKLLEFLPYVYLNHLEFFLADILKHNLTVPLVTLYGTQGKEIKSMQNSRKYFVSEAYKRMSEFVEEELNKEDLALSYANRSVTICDLNPDALFHYAYSIDDAEKEIELLERVVKLIEKSEALFDRNTYALYNNLGYSIWNAGKEDKYDVALKYLEIAYKDSDGEGVNSLGTMANIYIDQKKYKEAYEIIKDPVYTFLHNKDTDIVESADSAYWYFVRASIDTTFALKDTNATKHMCEKYFSLKDKEYEDCHQYIKDIEQLSDNDKNTTKPIYSFWKLYTEPEIYNMAATSKEVLGTLQCGTVMTYANSLKYKSTSRKQRNLLQKFTTLYAPHKVPDTLKELIKIEENLGADSYTISFYLDPDNREEFFQGTFSYEDKELNKKVAKHFFPLAHVDGTGTNAALWAVNGNETNLENAPIVEFGSEGQINIIAKNLKDFIYMLSFGVEPMDGWYSQFVSINEENYRRENFEAYRKWLKETMKIEPVKDLEVWGTPKKIELMHEEAQALYRDKLFQWLYTLVPNHGVVEEGKQKADKFSALSKEKQRLKGLIDKNATAETYRLLARNEQRLEDIDRSLEENVLDYYKQAYALDHNKSTIEEWALFMSNFADNTEIKSDKDKARLYIGFSEVYSVLNDDIKAREHLDLALVLYKKSANDEKDDEKKMRLYEGIAEIYKDENQSSNAINYYKKALEVKVEDKQWLKKYYYVDLAEIYEEQKEYLLAIEGYKKAVSIVDKEKDKALYNYHIAENYKALGDLWQALDYARKSLVKAPKSTVLKEDVMELISAIKFLKNSKK